MINADNQLILEQDTFLSHYPQKHFQIRHNLAEHPLFKLDKLLELAQNLPPQHIEFNAGYAEISQNPSLTPRTTLSLEETIQNIATSESWVVLKYVEQLPEYSDLLTHCVDQVAPLAALKTPGMHQLEGYIFISSPHAVTPFHFDDEHNFLLQIQGCKDFHAWGLNSTGAATQRDIEAYYQGAHRNLPIRPNSPNADTVFTLHPGDGLHVPVHSPHWVKNGDAVSISFSITFRSAPLAREVAIHKVNGKLRRLGWSPRDIGQSPIIDKLKHRAWQLKNATKLPR